MQFLWFYIVCWRHRGHTQLEMFEQYTLVLKAARRCAYDLGHASASIPGKESTLFWERHYMWLEIFSPTGGKNYRHDLHNTIDSLQVEVKRLEKVCEDSNVDHENPDRIPF